MKHFLTFRRFVSLAALLTVAVVTAMAAPRSVEQAREVALQQMKKHGANRAAGVTNDGPRLVYSKAGKNATPCYYVFSAGANRGFTIVSGDDRLPAIVGYTENGDFDAAQLPDNLAGFMQAYQDFADNATDEQIAEVTAWRARAASKHEAVAPFMREEWNQRAPYNNMCPEYGTGERAVTGCVATAVAQILHYYGHPAALQADIPAYTTYKNHIEMPGIAAGAGYDWGNMLNVYTGSETQTQNDAVATLMLHVGCALRMDYGSSSGASASPETFTKYFGMDKELVGYYARSSYQIAEWDHMLYKEIAAKRPVYYDGQSEGGGHAFVIHGYDDGLYYVNWGWGGYSDGYFDITILNPHNTTGAGASSTDDGYSMDNGMIIGIQPDNGVVDEGVRPVFTAMFLGINGVAVNNGNIKTSATISVINFNSEMNTRYVGVGYIGKDFQIQNVATPQPVTIQAAPAEGKGYYQGTACDISFPCIDGVYKLDVIESTDGNNWMVCPQNTWSASPYRSVYLKVQNSAVSIIDPSPSLTATAELDAEHSGGYVGMNNTINITVSNSGDKEYYDMIHVRMSESSDMPAEDIYTTGITAPVGGSTTFNFAYTPEAAGTYNFWILDKDYNEIGRSNIEFKTTAAPVLSFVSIKCASASGEKAYAPYYDDMVAMDKVNDTKADFVFEIKNDGGYYEGQFGLYKYVNGDWRGRWETLRIPGNATTSFTFTAEGEVGDVVGYMLYSYDESASIAPLAEPNIHSLQESPYYYYQIFEGEICYLAGSGTVGMSAVKADKESNVYYNLRGEKVDAPSKGVYIKDGKKYVFK